MINNVHSRFLNHSSTVDFVCMFALIPAQGDLIGDCTHRDRRRLISYAKACFTYRYRIATNCVSYLGKHSQHDNNRLS